MKKPLSDNVSLEVPEVKQEDLSPEMKRRIKKAVEEQQRVDKENNTRKYRWESESIHVIKEKLDARRKLGLKNDWKVKFYEEKLKLKPKIISKLSKVI